MQGNVELATELKMIALFHRLPRDTVGRLKALITLSYALLLTVAALPAEATTDQMDDIAARTNHLAGLIRSLPDKIDAPSPDAPQQGEAQARSKFWLGSRDDAGAAGSAAGGPARATRL